MLEIRRYLNVQIDCKRLCAIVQTYIALLIELTVLSFWLKYFYKAMLSNRL